MEGDGDAAAAQDEELSMMDEDDVGEVLDDGDVADDLAAGLADGVEIDDHDGADIETAAHEQGEPAPPPTDMSVAKFDGHGDGFVLVVDWHPDGMRVASAGEDDKGYVWTAAYGGTLSPAVELGGHKDSVIAVGFNRDGTLVASGAMDGIIIVRNTADASAVCELDCGADLTWFDWHPKANFIIAGTADGQIYMWDVPGANMTYISGHGLTVTCGGWSPTGRNFMSGGEDGSLILWSPKTGAAIMRIDHKTQHKFHKEALNCATWSASGDLVATGGQDGFACVSNPKLGKVVGSFDLSEHSIESVSFSVTAPLMLAAGDLQGGLFIYDVTTGRKMHKLQCSDGVVKLAWHPTKHVVVTASVDGKLQVWDCSAGVMTSELTGHVGHILDFSLSPDGTKVVTCGEDETCRIFNLE